MKLLSLALGALLSAHHVQAKGAFAHFMVGNTVGFSVSDWEYQIDQAQIAHLDAFALNIAHGDAANDAQIPNAFTAAANKKFQLLFSFDYAGGDAGWAKSEVLGLLNQYATRTTYYKRGSQPLVSTFEGPGWANDWKDIKKQTGCFFIPDWSSLGAQTALALGVADGLFSWAAWPVGPNDMNTFVDASYLQFLGPGGVYMMPISPWFFTNMPGFSKNWLWRGDDLWYDRWEQVPAVNPEFIEIISWNDFGESHYIGPLKSTEYDAFTPKNGNSPYNYALDMPHDGWREMLPFLIDTWKNGNAAVTKEKLVTWYRTQPAKACGDGGTTGNTASHLQLEYYPYEIAQDKIFFSALLGSNDASVSVTVGGTTTKAAWSNVPDGGIGIYHGNVSFTGTGAVTVTLSRSTGTIASVSGKAITNTCTNNIENWNAWVGNATSPATISKTPATAMTARGCIAGYSIPQFNGLCEYTCQYDYCPIGACVCTLYGKKIPAPAVTKPKGYPVKGESSNYIGLCSYACERDHCPSQYCSYTDVGVDDSGPSPFNPDTCVAGTGAEPFTDLCEWDCAYGFCPKHSCTCSKTGILVPPPADDSSVNGYAIPGVFAEYKYLDSGMCKWSCSKGHCPSRACEDGTYNATAMCDLTPGPDAWEKTGAGAYLDNWIHTNGYSKWIWNLLDDIFGEVPDSWACTVAGGDCSLGHGCKEFVAAKGDDGVKAFWALFSVVNAHTILGAFKDALLEDTFLASLNVSDIAKEFSDTTTYNPFGLAGGAMGMASGLTFGAAPISASLGIVSGAMGIASTFYQPDDPTSNLTAQLADYFTKSTKALDKTLQNAFGYGDSTQLPISEHMGFVPVSQPTYSTNVANWFRDGTWLFDPNDMWKAIEPIIENGMARLKQGLIIRMLINQRKFLWARPDKDENDCTDPQIYDKTLKVCFRIYNNPTNIGQACAVDGYSTDKIHVMQDKYKIDMLDMYRNAWNCMRAHPNGGGDFEATDIVYDVSTLPKCFFNLPVLQADKVTEDSVDCFKNIVSATDWPAAPGPTSS